MLANLLPGLREVRAPLVSGYLWLAFFFLVLHSDLPSSRHPGSVLQPLFDLAGDLSALGLATVASVAAYLVGSAMQELVKLAGWLLRPNSPLYAAAGTHTSRRGRDSLGRSIFTQVDRISRRLFQVALSPGERGIAEAPGPWIVVRELPHVRTLLLGKDPELVGELDRLQAEADLRITVAVPLAALSVFLALESSLGWAVGLAAAAMLLIQGYQRQREAGDFLAGVLQMGRVVAPSVRDFEISVEAALERTELEWQLRGEMTEGDGMAAFRYGNLLTSAREFERAVEPLGVAVDNGVIQGYAALGLVWRELGDREKAERALRDGAERGDSKAREQLAELLREMRRTEEALETSEGDEPESESRSQGEASELPREQVRLADYQARAGQGDAKAALNLGLLASRRKEPDKAVDAFRLAASLDPEDPRPLFQLGLEESKRARFAEAKAALEEALEKQEATVGPEHLEVGETLAELGNVLSELGRDEESLSVRERALAIQEHELGQGATQVLITRGNIGKSLIHLGRFGEARDIYEQVLEAEERVLGKKSENVAITLNNLGSIRISLGQYRPALGLLERALKLKEELRMDPVSLSATRGNIGIAHSELGRHRLGLQMLAEALSVQEGHFGADSVPVTYSLDHLGEILNRLGKYDQALTLLDRSWGIKEAQGASALRVAPTLLARAEALAGTGALEQAIAVAARAQAIFEERLGEGDPQVAKALVVGGEAYLSREEFGRAQRRLGQAIDLGEASDDERDFYLPRALRAMARLELQAGQTARADSLASQAIKELEKRFGPLHPELATSLEVWADVREGAGEAETAKAARRRAAEIRRKMAADDDPDGEGDPAPID